MSFCLVFVASSCDKEVLEGPEGTENGEGTEGPEGSGDESGDESGMMWKVEETASETLNGIKLTLTYDSVNELFVGTLENLNTSIAPRVRVEVHVFDSTGKSTEYGPTTPRDMAPGEIFNVTLSTAGAGAFVTFTMHPEVG